MNDDAARTSTIKGRISNFCREANPDCVTQFEACDIGRVQPTFHIPGDTPIRVTYAVDAALLAAMSDDQLWKWLGVVTGGKITRPSIIG